MRASLWGPEYTRIHHSSISFLACPNTCSQHDSRARVHWQLQPTPTATKSLNNDVEPSGGWGQLDHHRNRSPASLMELDHHADDDDDGVWVATQLQQ